MRGQVPDGNNDRVNLDAVAWRQAIIEGCGTYLGRFRGRCLVRRVSARSLFRINEAETALNPTHDQSDHITTAILWQ